MTNEVLLRQQTGKAQGREIPLVGVTVIGRSEDTDLVVEDGQASRRNAELRPNRDDWQIIDLGSTSKTFLNDIALTPKCLAPSHTSTRARKPLGLHFWELVWHTFCQVSGFSGAKANNNNGGGMNSPLISTQCPPARTIITF